MADTAATAVAALMAAAGTAADEQHTQMQMQTRSDHESGDDGEGEETGGGGGGGGASAGGSSVVVSVSGAIVDTSGMSRAELRNFKKRERYHAERRAMIAAGIPIPKKKSKVKFSSKKQMSASRIAQQQPVVVASTHSEAGDMASAASPAKRHKRAHHSSSSAAAAAAHADHDEVEAHAAGPSSTSGTPSPAVWSILADLVYLPKFLELVHGHLASTRSVNINFHIVSSNFRQKLTEGGWARDAHYVLHGSLPAEGADGATATAAASSSHSRSHPAGVYLTKSKRSVSDFTPTVCRQLWRLIAYHRDPSPQAAMEMLAAGARHRQLEERCRQMAIPLQIGGKWVPSPQGAALKLERMFGLPPEGAEIAARKQPAVAVAAAAAAAASGQSADAGAATSAALVDAAGDDDSDVEDTFEHWPGVYTPNQMLHGSQHSLDGATIDRWAKGWHAHVPPPPPNAVPCCPPPEGAPLATLSPEHIAATAAVSAILADPTHPQHASVQQLSSHAHLVHLCNDSRRQLRTQLARNNLFVDLHTGEWTDPPSAGQVQLKLSSQTQVGPPPAMWVSPFDDYNFLDAILDWLQRQPKPTAETFRSSTDGASSALLPQTTSDWLEIRHACSAHEFPIGFLRRRWWVLCNQSNLFDLADHAGKIPRPCANPSVERLAEKVGAITLLLTERVGEYAQKQQILLQQRLHTRAQQQAALHADAQQLADTMLAAQHEEQEEQQEQPQQPPVEPDEVPPADAATPAVLADVIVDAAAPVAAAEDAVAEDADADAAPVTSTAPFEPAAAVDIDPAPSSSLSDSQEAAVVAPAPAFDTAPAAAATEGAGEDGPQPMEMA